MKIALITRCLCDGGTERVAARLSLVWSGLGHKVTYLTVCEPRNYDFEHAEGAREVAPSGGWSAADARRMQAKYGFDLIVLNGGWNDDWVLAFMMAFKEGGMVKVAAILHHCFNNWAFCQANYRDFDKDELLPLVDVLVCVDRTQALWWSRRHPAVVYVPNPVALKKEARVISCDGGERHNLVWVGRPKDWGKRVEIVYKVIAKIREQVPAARLTVIGDITERLKRGAGDGIEFVGYVRDTTPYLQKAAINLVTTLWEVTVPQVVLEAGIMGVPTVAMDLPVFRGCDGMLLAGSVDEMVDMAVGLLKDKNRRDELAAAAMQDVERRASFETVNGKWRELFAAMEGGSFADFVAAHREEYVTIENAYAVIDEVQRGEAFFIARHFASILQMVRWKGWFARLRRLMLCRK